MNLFHSGQLILTSGLCVLYVHCMCVVCVLYVYAIMYLKIFYVFFENQPMYSVGRSLIVLKTPCMNYMQYP